VKLGYVPEKGDVVWLDFDPQTGHEQSGRRPAFVLSPAKYNGRTGLMLCCPVSTQVKGYPFEVTIEGNAKVKGAVLADQVKSLDWQKRKAEKKGSVSEVVIEEVIEKIKAILED
jgi:mRNA interferase MazF